MFCTRSANILFFSVFWVCYHCLRSRISGGYYLRLWVFSVKYILVLINLYYFYHAPCSMLHAQYSVLSAPCSLLRAPYSVLRAPCSVLRAPCSVLRAPCSGLSAPCSVLRVYVISGIFLRIASACFSVLGSILTCISAEFSLIKLY